MNEIIKWDDKYSVFNTEIDNQHKKLFDMINEFYNSMSKNQTNAGIQKVIAEMKAYALKHFAYEESLMKMKKYPRLSNHQLSHKNFADKVADLEGKLKRGAPVLATDITKFLKDWLINHILMEDKSYGNFFKSNGLL
jgi:hemerythrin-like metal-binding protein